MGDRYPSFFGPVLPQAPDAPEAFTAQELVAIRARRLEADLALAGSTAWPTTAVRDDASRRPDAASELHTAAPERRRSVFVARDGRRLPACPSGVERRVGCATPLAPDDRRLPALQIVRGAHPLRRRFAEAQSGSRYGLVGANGSGKTTFLKILAGDEPATEGSVSLPKTARVGVLRQDRFLADEDIILDVTMMGDRVVWDALVEQRRIIEDGHGDPARLVDLDDVLAAHDGHTLEARATSVLEGLGIPRAAHRQPLATLSGGFKLRVLLAQVLIGGPDLLFLDEPTNHLDILSIRWLEKFLAGYKGCAVVISHDQRFLDNVATHILDVDYATITLYTGNYTAFTVEKQATRDAKRRRSPAPRRRSPTSTPLSTASAQGHQGPPGPEPAQADREDRGRGARDDRRRRAPLFRFTPERPSGRDVLEIEAVSKAYGDKRVLARCLARRPPGREAGGHRAQRPRQVDAAPDRDRPPRGRRGRRFAGGMKRASGYFAQDHHDILTDPATTPLDYVWEVCPTRGPRSCGASSDGCSSPATT